MSDSPVKNRVEKHSHIVGLFFVFLTAGCADLSRAPPQTGATRSGTAEGGAAEVAAPAGRPTTLPTDRSKGQSANKVQSPAAKVPAKVVATHAPVKQLPKKEIAMAVPMLKKRQALPPLDLASLKSRLKQTKAIGTLSKISLKNQVDDLLDQFREYYQGSLSTTLAELRQRYDLLLLKVLTLLQDSDQALATAIGASREAIWSILTDRQKFAAI